MASNAAHHAQQPDFDGDVDVPRQSAVLETEPPFTPRLATAAQKKPMPDSSSPSIHPTETSPPAKKGFKSAETTPPYTPARQQRLFEKSYSPAWSVHPIETSSPAEEALERIESDNLPAVELPEGDSSSFPDAVSPLELEEAEDVLSETRSYVDEPTYESGSDSDFDSGISSRFSRLNCEEQEEQSEMAQRRLERRLSKRVTPRVIKRPHSQSADYDNGDAGIRRLRRLRRRVLKLIGGPIGWEDGNSSPELDVFDSPKKKFLGGQVRKVPRTSASVLRGDDDAFAMEGSNPGTTDHSTLQDAAGESSPEILYENLLPQGDPNSTDSRHRIRQSPSNIDESSTREEDSGNLSTDESESHVPHKDKYSLEKAFAHEICKTFDLLAQRQFILNSEVALRLLYAFYVIIGKRASSMAQRSAASFIRRGQE